MQNTDEGKSALEALNRDMGEAEKTRDAEFFRGVLADDLAFHRANNKIVDKEKFLDDLVSSQNRFERLNPTQIEVTPLEDMAVVTLLVDARMVRPNEEGKPEVIEGLYPNTRLFLPAEGTKGWRCAVWFNTQPTGPQHPGARASLQEARDTLQGELVALSVVGRGLTPEEERTLAILPRAIELLDQALALLQA